MNVHSEILAGTDESIDVRDFMTGGMCDAPPLTILHLDWIGWLTIVPSLPLDRCSAKGDDRYPQRHGEAKRNDQVDHQDVETVTSFRIVLLPSSAGSTGSVGMVVLLFGCVIMNPFYEILNMLSRMRLVSSSMLLVFNMPARVLLGLRAAASIQRALSTSNVCAISCATAITGS